MCLHSHEAFIALQDVEVDMGPTIFLPGTHTAAAHARFNGDAATKRFVAIELIKLSLYQSLIAVTDSSSTSVTPGVFVGFGSSILEQTEGLPGRLQVPRRPAAARRRADHGLSPPTLRVGQHFGRHTPRLAVYLLPKPALR